MNTKEKRTTTYYTPEELELMESGPLSDIFQNITEKINDTDYPCVGAKAAVNSKQFRVGIYGNMATESTTLQLGEDLKNYIKETIESDSEYMTMIAVFENEDPESEQSFEKKLWSQLQYLHNTDTHALPWDPEVSSNPKDDDFSFSYNGTAFFIVGLHPKASRKARRFGYTALAFNLHRQFEQLREKGVYENMKKVIREREELYDGSVNPMLNDFGEGLEAPQYSGRQVDESWKCPFHKNR
ncbi:guanitoxin biosynthesis heme-dependent pre-guanitoxin N-hydroxylase GntA [Pontibacter locisalis]|uniref:Guanitoxin biosynthesis heme-dependent pre-guanitoxin N-hydroxylase GntA n=1 Tax=Pontibacter locisalis TaxID=1719035 RepID=A0ABW5II35_9BACT